MHSEMSSCDITGWLMKLGSIMDRGSMGPLPTRFSKSFKNGGRKSASTPSMSKPIIMRCVTESAFLAQSKQMLPGRQAITICVSCQFSQEYATEKGCSKIEFKERRPDGRSEERRVGKECRSRWS